MTDDEVYSLVHYYEKMTMGKAVNLSDSQP